LGATNLPKLVEVVANYAFGFWCLIFLAWLLWVLVLGVIHNGNFREMRSPRLLNWLYWAWTLPAVMPLALAKWTFVRAASFLRSIVGRTK
jgi:hypothetical protein